MCNCITQSRKKLLWRCLLQTTLCRPQVTLYVLLKTDPQSVLHHLTSLVMVHLHTAMVYLNVVHNGKPWSMRYVPQNLSSILDGFRVHVQL